MKNCDQLLSLLNESTTLKSDATALCTIPYHDPVFRGFQGGCSDGERYYYQVLMHYELSDRSKDYSCIAKVDMRTTEVVKYSGVLHIDHANDVTYHRGRNELIVTNNKPNHTRLTVIDPETLGVIGTRECEFPLYALEYNEKRDLYVAGLSGTRSFRFLDADLRPVDDRVYRTTYETDRCTKQGICADDNLLYFILWDGKHKDLPDFQNRVALYDWEGNARGELHFDIGVEEPESISIVNGEIIAVVCGDKKPVLYHLEPRLAK